MHGEILVESAGTWAFRSKLRTLDGEFGGNLKMDLCESSYPRVNSENGN